MLSSFTPGTFQDNLGREGGGRGVDEGKGGEGEVGACGPKKATRLIGIKMEYYERPNIQHFKYQHMDTYFVCTYINTNTFFEYMYMLYH